jgi:DNA repair protein RadA/Sms
VGEVGLGGELRSVSQVERRLAEADRMGFRTAYLSARAVPARSPGEIALVPVGDLAGLTGALFR